MKKLNNKRILTFLLRVVSDFVLVYLSYCLAVFLKFEPDWPQGVRTFLSLTALFSLIHVLVFAFTKSYVRMWRYSNVSDILRTFFANLLSLVIVYLLFLFFYSKLLGLDTQVYSITFFLIVLIGVNITTVFIRIAYRVFVAIDSMYDLIFVRHHRTADSRVKVLLVGAGEAGSIIMQEISNNARDRYRVECILDDDPEKLGLSLSGCLVVGNTDQIEEMAKTYRVDEIIVAVPSADSAQLAAILNKCTKTDCRVRVMPSLSEIPENHALRNVRSVRIEDLLGRESIDLDNENISRYLTDAVVLVTGGGGSIGSELCRQIMNFAPKRLVIYDIYENNAYELYNELQIHNQKHIPIDIRIGSVRDPERLDQVFTKFCPDIVFHAAAYKHVPLMEEAPKEAVLNNVFGTYYTAQAACKHGVKRFVMISTDKAVNPTSVMGATKRIAEMVVQSMNNVCKTEFVAVRFGNVLGSNGSVIPLFCKQIEHGGPVTVTHPEITRFFMTIPEAAQLVVQAGAMAKGGEIFILDMGEPVKIVDLAEKYIRFSGYTPGLDMEIKFVGLRPGEKLYEELLLSEEGIQKSENNKIYIAKPCTFRADECERIVAKLTEAIEQHRIIECIGELVPTFTHEKNAEYES